VDWIRTLIEYVSKRPNLFLLIRVHPREFPNKRETRQVSTSALLASAFGHLPSNARVNWPSDDIALYDLANYGRCVFELLVRAQGKEMALLGIPVVAYSRDLMLYPPDLNYVANSEQDFFAKIGAGAR